MQERINNETDWLARRLSVITATEAASLVGLNPYKTPAQVYRDKKDPGTFTGNEYTQVGQLLEPVVVELTNKLLGTKYELCENSEGKWFLTRDDIRLGATPDAYDGQRFLECKTTKPLNLLRYRDCPPKYYVVQLMVQMYCAGIQEGHLAIMSTNLSPRKDLPIAVFEVKLNETLMGLIHKEVIRFWEHDKTMRVNSAVKRLAEATIRTCYRRIL